MDKNNSRLIVGRRQLLKTGAAAGFAGSSLLGFGSGTVRAASNSSWDRIAETGVVRMGVLSNHEPYHNLEQGKWVGFAIEMGLDATAQLSAAMKKPLKVEYFETTLATVILDIQSDKLDMYVGLSDSEERRKAIWLFGPIYELPECAINSKGFNPGDTWDKYNNPSVTVSVVLGSTDEQAARKMLPNAKIRALKSTAEAILDIQSGNSQMMVNTLLSGMAAAKATPNLSTPLVLSPLLNQPSMGGTRRDGDGKLGDFLMAWALKYRADGKSRESIIAAMKHSGLDVSNLPATLKF